MVITKKAAADSLAADSLADAKKIENIIVQASSEINAILDAYDDIPTGIKLTHLDEANHFKNMMSGLLNQIKMRRDSEAASTQILQPTIPIPPAA